MTASDISPRPVSALTGVPARDVASSVFGFGPIPIRHVFTAPRLLHERTRLDLPIQAGAHTPLETTVRLRAELAAERYLDRRARGALGSRARRLTRLTARLDAHDRDLDRLDQGVCRDVSGETITLETAQRRVDELSRVAEESLATGSEKHRTESPWRKRLLLFFVLADFALFAYFMSRILNVDVFMPATDPIAFTTSIVFALLFTLGIASALHHFGHAHRVFKDDRGTVVLPEGAVRLRAEVAFVHLLMLLPGVLIGVRIFDDAALAGSPWGLSLLLALAIGVVMAGVNLMLYRTELRDGTPLTDRLLLLSGQVRRARLTEQRIATRQSRLEHRLILASARARRTCARVDQTADRIANRGPSVTTLHYTRSLAGSIREGASLPRVTPARQHADEVRRQIDAATPHRDVTTCRSPSKPSGMS